MDHAARLSRLRSGIDENKLDALLVTHLPNIRYLCGFTGSAAALMVADSGTFLFTDGRYRTQAKHEVKGAGGSHCQRVAAGGGCGVAGRAAKTFDARIARH